MQQPIEQFFLNRFIEYNVARYAESDPVFAAKIAALTLDKVTFTNLRKDTSGEQPVYTVDMEARKLFKAPNQSFTPGDYVFNGPSTLEMDRILDPVQLGNRFNPGIYKFQEQPELPNIGAVLVPVGQRTEAVIRQQVKNSCDYVLQDSEITVAEDLSTVTVSSMTIVGILTVVESNNTDGSAYYDGIYDHDGTITY